MTTKLHSRTLSPAAERFLSQLKAALTSPGSPVARVAQQRQRGVFSVSFNNTAAVLLVLVDEVPGAEAVPVPSRIIADLERSVPAQVAVLDTILLVAEDYTRHAAIAAHVHGLLTHHQLNLSAEDLAALLKQGASPGVRFALHLDADTAAAKNLLNSMWPHAVMPRVDYGVLLTMQTHAPVKTTAPLLIVGGFLEFGVDEAGATHNLFRITVIHSLSALPHWFAVPCAVGALRRTLLDRGDWTDLVAPVPEAMAATMASKQMSETAVRHLAATQLPQLALDVCDGQAKAPALRRFLTPAAYRAELIRDTLPLGLTLAGPAAVPGTVFSGESVGAVRLDSGQPCDSRTTLTPDIIAASIEMHGDRAKDLCTFCDLEHRHAALTACLGPHYRPLYDCHTVVLSPQYVGLVGAGLGALLSEVGQ